jgi:hypothetical protein
MSNLLGCIAPPTRNRLFPIAFCLPTLPVAVAPARIAVPTFFAVRTAPANVAPAVQSAYQVPTWPHVNVVRGHLYSGDKADIEITDAARLTHPLISSPTETCQTARN